MNGYGALVRDEVDDFVCTHPNGSFMQMPCWAQTRPDWESELLCVRGSGQKIEATMLLLFRTVPLLGTVAYAPRGPVCDYHDPTTVNAILSLAKDAAMRRHAIFLRVDPPMQAQDSRAIELFQQFGFKPPVCAFARTIQTAENYLIPLSGKSLQEILSACSPKCRYNIRLAQRKGVECRAVDPFEYLDRFYALMQETSLRDDFPCRPKGYFSDLFKAFGPENCRLFMSFYGGVPLSGAIAIRRGDTVSYLYGASSGKVREVMPNHLMQWEIIRWAHAEHCALYDMMGVPNHCFKDAPEYGLYRFKKGFGGEVCEYAGQFDLVFRPLRARLLPVIRRLYSAAVKKRNRLRQAALL